MLKNLHIKILALFASIIFWFFVVSLENTFIRFPSEIPIQVFNQSSDLALASKLGTVKLTLRTQNAEALKALSPSDFEAYVDLRNIGAGQRRVPVSVSSKNPQVSVVSATPNEIEINLEPMREKIITLAPEVKGQPAEGFKVDSVQLTKTQITVAGAESLLRQIANARAQILLDGNERQNLTKSAAIVIVNRDDVPIEGLVIEDKDVDAQISIIESDISRQLGIRPKFAGASDGTVKNIEITPGVVSVNGGRDALERLNYIETEPIDLKDLSGTVEKTVKLVLPAGVSLASGEKDEVKVKFEIQ